MIKYSDALSKVQLVELNQICGEGNVLFKTEDKEVYGSDETEDFHFVPAVVVKPANAEEISAILKLANREKIPVTPRGAGTGLSGGALPVFGGIVLSTERLNKIIEIDERNLQATVEPGVINQIFRDAVEAKGLFYPPDPASRGSCFLGGNLAENAGGPKAVKYGTTKDYVLNCEVVLPTGEIIWTGANVLKNSTGYNLTQLIVGSEGTLGIITKIVFRLIPLPTQNLLMLIPFFSPEKACEAVSAVFRAGFTPSAMEFMERDAIDFVLKFVDVKIPVKEEHKAHLLIEVDGHDIDALFKDCERITEIMYTYDCDEVMFADTTQQKSDLWRMRRAVGEAVKSHSVYKEEDTVVPRAELPVLLKGVKDIGRKYGFNSVCYGHAGDGNLHVNIIRGDMSETDWNEKVPLGIREIFELCVRLKGTISGEHGIGYVQKNYMDIPFNPTQLALQKGIKQLFDPNGILNPGKMFV
ncbi:MAG: FAD-binding protein [Bacteroidetes bacterium]|nr:FAD-binding protein [Bacteroidota bacterium]